MKRVEQAALQQEQERVLSAGPSKEEENKQTFDPKEFKNQFKELAEIAAAEATLSAKGLQRSTTIKKK